MRDTLLDDLIAACRTLMDDRETLAVFIERCADSGDCAAMVLRQFAGQYEGSNCVNLSTLHSSKGRQFSVVVMFGMDDGRIPRNNTGPRQLVEARRLSYVGFPRERLNCT